MSEEQIIEKAVELLMKATSTDVHYANDREVCEALGMLKTLLKGKIMIQKTKNY